MRISERTYNVNEVIAFSKTSGKFGGLSNMAPGYSLFVNETNIANTEILYQACRFPLFPSIQQEIISQTNPMEAKEISRKYNQYTRQDWEEVKFDIMSWCLQIKLLQNYDKFSALLISTYAKPIVEYSTKDDVWGAIPTDSNTLKGKNALGRLLMQMREVYLKGFKDIEYVKPLNIPAFLLFDNPIDKAYKPEIVIHDLDDIYAY
ncbi:NADAR family protein [Flavobacterium supellecticarium]|uniref:NADAR family protein n=1 Tax=Flavobacterium supellecticarium TaxID=2565924 RepID=A0A4S4A0G0_9FLAO|nr:NADAR family protein [Flavobacterium supellecticarium]THF51738.1 NADAR family protein [Flavobacterium supellecticarium]